MITFSQTNRELDHMTSFNPFAKKSPKENPSTTSTYGPYSEGVTARQKYIEEMIEAEKMYKGYHHGVHIDSTSKLTPSWELSSTPTTNPYVSTVELEKRIKKLEQGEKKRNEEMVKIFAAIMDVKLEDIKDD